MDSIAQTTLTNVQMPPTRVVPAHNAWTPTAPMNAPVLLAISWMSTAYAKVFANRSISSNICEAVIYRYRFAH